VMISHLHHKVIPIQEVRADIPLWACDWIMWMLNRMPADRPESAREALQVFFQNDKNPKPTMSLGKAAPAIPAGPRARLAIPGGSSTQQATPTKRIITDPRMAPLGYVPPVVEPPPAEPPPEPPAKPITAPQPLLPPEGSKPSIYTAPNEIPDNLPPTPTVGGTILVPAKHYHAPPGTGAKKGRKTLIIALSIVSLGILGFLLANRIKASKASQRFSTLLVSASEAGTTEIPMTGPELQYFLDLAANADTEEKQKQVFQLLALAKSTDETDFNATISQFTTTSTQLLPEVRAAMIHEVLEKRISPAMAPILVDFSRSTKDIGSAIAALRAVRTVVNDNQFDPFFSVVQGHPDAELRQAAEECLTEILRKSSRRSEFAKQINGALKSITDSKIRESLQRLKTAAGD
jgi:hypothetical protein